MIYFYDKDLPFTIIEEEKRGEDVVCYKLSQFRFFADVLKAFNQADHTNHTYRLIVPNESAYINKIKLDKNWILDQKKWEEICSSDHLDKSINTEEAFASYQRRKFKERRVKDDEK